jgi:uncharacterized membrane protein YbhN (UPF0104 family)
MRRLGLWVGLLGSLAFMWLALRGVDFDRVVHTLRTASYWPLLPAVAVLALATWLRAVRWQALFDHRTRPSMGPVMNAMLIGLLFNSILPARAGEAARILALWREAGTSRAEAAATAVAERVYDVFALLGLLFVAAPFLPHVAWLGRAAVLAAAAVVGLAALIVVLVRWEGRPLLFIAARVPIVGGDRAEGVAANAVQGLTSFRRPRIAFVAFALTLLSWLVLALSAWLLLVGFGFDLGFGAALLVTIASALVLVIPAGPGGVGQFEAATVVALGAFHVDRSHALSYAVVFHALNLIPYLPAGYIALYRHSASVRARRRFA